MLGIEQKTAHAKTNLHAHCETKIDFNSNQREKNMASLLPWRSSGVVLVSLRIRIYIIRLE